ncbi:MAG: phycobiliprotein lyase [Oscillatoria sp. PMC 1068.18]|nr:phycobiliprotein lyase [Oscillatoria sp. PMC 1076.18]MEC4987767.1 phycobiliprotein lyase [Oscillatoria sp. PMC 1068.18]
MDIKKFFDLSAGKWLSQRSNYELNPPETQNKKSEVSIEIIDANTTQLGQICQANNLQITPTSLGAKITWDNSAEWGQTKQKGATFLILIPNEENPQTGKLFRKGSDNSSQLQTGRYLINSDESLTLIVEDSNIYAEERQWFASENLRMRMSLVKDNTGFNQAAFYSEIRRITSQ